MCERQEKLRNKRASAKLTLMGVIDDASTPSEVASAACEYTDTLEELFLHILTCSECNEGEDALHHLRRVTEAYIADTGAEPSVSVLARAVDEAEMYLKKVQNTDTTG